MYTLGMTATKIKFIWIACVLPSALSQFSACHFAGLFVSTCFFARSLGFSFVFSFFLQVVATCE